MTKSKKVSASERRSSKIGTVLLVVGGISLLASGGVWLLPLGLIAVGLFLLRERKVAPSTNVPSKEPEDGEQLVKDVSHIEQPSWDALLDELERGELKRV